MLYIFALQYCCCTLVAALGEITFALRIGSREQWIDLCRSDGAIQSSLYVATDWQKGKLARNWRKKAWKWD